MRVEWVFWWWGVDSCFSPASDEWTVLPTRMEKLIKVCKEGGGCSGGGRWWRVVMESCFAPLLVTVLYILQGGDRSSSRYVGWWSGCWWWCESGGGVVVVLVGTLMLRPRHRSSSRCVKGEGWLWGGEGMGRGGCVGLCVWVEWW